MKIHVNTNTSLFYEDPDRICEYHYQENQKLRENRTNCGSDHVTFSGLYNPHKHHDCQIRLHSVNISDSGIWRCELVGTTGFQQSVNFKILIFDPDYYLGIISPLPTTICEYNFESKNGAKDLGNIRL